MPNSGILAHKKWILAHKKWDLDCDYSLTPILLLELLIVEFKPGSTLDQEPLSAVIEPDLFELRRGGGFELHFKATVELGP